MVDWDLRGSSTRFLDVVAIGVKACGELSPAHRRTRFAGAVVELIPVVAAMSAGEVVISIGASRVAMRMRRLPVRCSITAASKSHIGPGVDDPGGPRVVTRQQVWIAVLE